MLKQHDQDISNHRNNKKKYGIGNFQKMLVAFIISAGLVLGNAGNVFAALDSKGTEFWLMFNENESSSTLSLFITGDIATTGTVSIPGQGFNHNFNVVPGTVTTVAIPSSAAVTGSDSIQNKGIRVIASDEVTIYGLNRLQATTDAFLGLPVDILGTEYYNLGYRNTNVINATQFGIVATENDTTVTITPTVNAGSGRTANTPFNIILNQGQAYQLRSTLSFPADLSGTRITSDKPIAVFGSHRCANIPQGALYCDHIVEQLPPVGTWGKSFVTLPLATRINGDTFRIIAGTAGTEVFINGISVVTLNAGQFHEQIIDGPATITATEPVLVAQYSNGTTFDGVTSDPFMMLIPPFEQFLGNYTVTTPASGFRINYINVVTPDAAVGSINLDGFPIPSADFIPIGGSGFSGAQVDVTLGSHNLASPLPFGIFVYGFDEYDSYGYPGGQSLAEVAIVASLNLTPENAISPTGTQHCIDGLVADQNGIPVPGVRVDYVITGDNSAAGFANADGNGIARFCYVGTNVGTDIIEGFVGALRDSVTKQWVTGNLACDVNSDGIVDRTDLSLISRARGQDASLGDPGDADGDGKITPNDVKICTTRLTR